MDQDSQILRLLGETKTDEGDLVTCELEEVHDVRC
jgi:hypothetical protein